MKLKLPENDNDLMDILSRVYEIKELHAYKRIRDVAGAYGAQERDKNFNGNAWNGVLKTAEDIGGENHFMCEQLELYIDEIKHLRTFKREILAAVNK